MDVDRDRRLGPPPSATLKPQPSPPGLVPSPLSLAIEQDSNDSKQERKKTYQVLGNTPSNKLTTSPQEDPLSESPRSSSKDPSSLLLVLIAGSPGKSPFNNPWAREDEPVLNNLKPPEPPKLVVPSSENPWDDEQWENDPFKLPEPEIPLSQNESLGALSSYNFKD